MALIEIEDVVSLAETSEHVAGSSIEVPGSSSERDVWWIPVSGWAVGRHEPITSVEVVHQHQSVRTAPVEIERVDVARAHPGLPGAERAGFSLRVGAIWLPESFVLRLEAGFATGHHVPLALIRGRRAPLGVPDQTTIQPISVTALDRSGSTLMMNMLSRHPEVVVHGAHPYASRPGAYWTHMLRVLSEPADVRGSAAPETFEQNLHWVGSHPLNDAPATDPASVGAWFGRGYVEDLGRFCKRSAESFYLQVAADQGVEAPRYYAEKQDPGGSARLLAGLYPNGREILVVRDFRDMACSMLAYFRMTGRISYGRDQVQSDEDFVVSLAPGVARLASYAREREGAISIVRYEDLVARPHETLSATLDYLGLETSDIEIDAIVAQATADTPELAEHRTTADGASSIGRYAGDMRATVLEAAEEALGPALDAFGYSSQASTGPAASAAPEAKLAIR